MFAVVAVPVLVGQWRRTRREGSEYPSTFVKVFGPLYLAVLAVLWLTALPDYAGAIDGTTSSGTPIGNVAYATVCFVFAGYCVVGVSTVVAAWTAASSVRRSACSPGLIRRARPTRSRTWAGDTVRGSAGGPAVRCCASTLAVSGTNRRDAASISRESSADMARTTARAIGVTAASTAAG